MKNLPPRRRGPRPPPKKPHSEQAGPRLARGAACGYGPGRLIRIAEYNRIGTFSAAGRDGSRTRRLSDRRRSPPGSHHGDPCAAGKEACWRFTACPFTEDNSTRGPERCGTGECLGADTIAESAELRRSDATGPARSILPLVAATRGCSAGARLRWCRDRPRCGLSPCPRFAG